MSEAGLLDTGETCSRCGKTLAPVDTTFHTLGAVFCRECFETRMAPPAICECCHQKFPGIRASILPGGYICPDCLRKALLGGHKYSQSLELLAEISKQTLAEAPK